MKIAIMGYGTVGSGVYEVLVTNAAGITVRAGEAITVERILDLREFPDHPEAYKFTKNVDDIINDAEIGLVVETMGGTEPAFTFACRAINAGKSYVTSNKELVAAKGPELMALAKENGVSFLFEASVGGGIPIIMPLKECLAGNEISEIMGILNGTTNYILTQMFSCGASFADALSEAQQKGYAEANPDADVLGYDTCRKIAILTSLACGKHVDFSQISTEGITGIDEKDVAFAEGFRSSVKLVGYSCVKDNKTYCRVAPMIIPHDHPLYSVEDVFNAILVTGNAIGDCMFYGRGAGKLPTASAVVSDVIAATTGKISIPPTWVRTDEDMMLDKASVFSRRMLRVTADAAEDVKKLFTCISSDTTPKAPNEIAFTVEAVSETEFAEKSAVLGDKLIKAIYMA